MRLLPLEKVYTRTLSWCDLATCRCDRLVGAISLVVGANLMFVGAIATLVGAISLLVGASLIFVGAISLLVGASLIFVGAI